MESRLFYLLFGIFSLLSLVLFIIPPDIFDKFLLAEKFVKFLANHLPFIERIYLTGNQNISLYLAINFIYSSFLSIFISVGFILYQYKLKKDENLKLSFGVEILAFVFGVFVFIIFFAYFYIGGEFWDKSYGRYEKIPLIDQALNSPNFTVWFHITMQNLNLAFLVPATLLYGVEIFRKRL